jgi:diguanylate cyclase (GGDEF)-like protein
MRTLTAVSAAAALFASATAGLAVVGSRRTQRRLRVVRAELRAVRAALAEAERRALTDPLTGLANRAAFEAELDRRLAGDGPFAVLLVDLDLFKPINDIHGHDVGDLVLQAVARRLDAATDLTGDLAARLGGDEFALLADCPDATIATRMQAPGLVRTVRLPIDAGGGLQVQVTASVGVLFVQPGSPAADVMHSADLALYQAKNAGGNGAVDFGPGPLAPAPTVRPRTRLREVHRTCGERQALLTAAGR